MNRLLFGYYYDILNETDLQGINLPNQGYKSRMEVFYEDEKRTDIIQTVVLGSADKLISFCQGLQKGMPVEAYVSPEPWDMPGYQDPVIMAAGAFIQGATSELSADAPMREPYTVYLQGGLTYESGKAGILLAVNELLK